jgi:aspartyl-tRNA(Asn)/glutamyl-tRNA(Gln) amidotransferase subunit B
MNLTIEKLDENLIQKIIDMILLIKSNKINAKQGKIIIEHLFTSTKTVSQIIEELGFSQITDASFLYKIVQNILENNKEVIVSNKDRIERIEKFFIGLVMKETKGQANPNIVKNIYDDLIKKYI